ncbi:hypothetical protein BGZ63DRAFT_3632 [Mariannaea sp. PMI_226]|nr:hypothetical protein BGZ63DRAFT_3632 [Mariannaea sp. PMI_226]
MAAPSEKTLLDLNGHWVLNKTLSDSSEPVLALQGIGFLTRKGINMASITLDINQYQAPPKPPSTATDVVYHVDITQTASGLKSTQENRCLDNEFRPHADWLFGKVKGKTTWVTLDEVDDEFLKKDLLVEGEGKFIKSYVESEDTNWVATQVWGFEIVDGLRRYSRHIVVTKGSERAQIRLVYDYTPDSQ